MKKSTININEVKKMAVSELYKKLESGRSGLTSAEAKNRIQQYGYNEISEKKTNPLIKFLSYYWGPIPWMIEIAAVLSALIGHWADFWIIFTLLMLNSVVGFWQEHKADNAIDLLKKKLSLKAKVMRDGKWIGILSRELVPGDIIRVRLGDIMPADVKFVQGDYVSVDESALTGESLPVSKKISDIGYDGSIVRQGEMNALVVSTGMNTFFGKTAKLVTDTKTESHFQKAVLKIGDYLIVLAIFLVTLIFFVALFRNESILDTLQFALVLTVAAIPVALPAVLSVTMAVGAINLSKKKAIVSKLSAIEEMAGMDILCCDKTGTITKNELTLDKIESFDGFTENDVLLFSALASRAEDNDPIDNAIVSVAKSKAEVLNKIGSYEVEKFKPFDPITKYTEATIKDLSGNTFMVSKGAPQAISALVKNNNKEISARVSMKVEVLAKKGYRALGVGRTDSQGNWQFAGIIPLYDPPREDSAETLRTAEKMGVDVKMVTGDHIAIAKEISGQIGLGSNVLPASSVLDTINVETEHLVENADGFAEVFPEHKFRIVKLLQKMGHIVGMTGDGVNDAPALKKANIGIAVAGATDAAKSAASIVLTSPGLSVIIDAIKESRKIFRRMYSYALYRIAETIRILLFITLSILVFRFYPITALMIVLLALLNDAPIMTIAFDNVREAIKPEKWDMREVLTMSTVLGIVGVFSSFGIFYIAMRVLHLNKPMVQSFIYLKLSVAGHLTVLVTRTRKHFWSIKPAKQLLLAIISTQAIATLITVYGILLTPIGWKLALFVWGYALAAFVITDYVKVWTYRVMDHEGIVFHR